MNVQTDQGPGYIITWRIPRMASRQSLSCLLFYLSVPIQAGVITGSIIGVVLGLLLLIVVIYYLMRFLVDRRVFNLSVRSVPLCLGLGPSSEPIPGLDTCMV
jgi:hypothetical protein